MLVQKWDEDKWDRELGMSGEVYSGTCGGSHDGGGGLGQTKRGRMVSRTCF